MMFTRANCESDEKENEEEEEENIFLSKPRKAKDRLSPSRIPNSPKQTVSHHLDFWDESKEKAGRIGKKCSFSESLFVSERPFLPRPLPHFSVFPSLLNSASKLEKYERRAEEGEWEMPFFAVRDFARQKSFSQKCRPSYQVTAYNIRSKLLCKICHGEKRIKKESWYPRPQNF